MRAAVLHGTRDLRVEDVPVPTTLGPHDCRVRVGAVGVCGSDVHYYEHGRIGPFVVEKPMILGHECAGTVVEVGAHVKGITEGQRVAIEPGVPCRRCRFCHEGKYNLCRDVVFLATPPVDGAFCEYVVSPADFLFALPDAMTLEQGALVEPLAVGVHAARRGGVKPGDTVAVIGMGTIGLLTLQAAAAHGATRAIAADVQPNRLAAAGQVGATRLVNAASESVVEAVHEETNGLGADVVFETAGTVATVQQTTECVRPGGVVVLVGLPPESEFPFDVMSLLNREFDVRGVFRYANAYRACVDLIATGRVNVEPLVTARYRLEEAEEALVFASTRKDSCIKVAVTVP
ncbi:MAG TPA: NAD(P)-dependent alcohol dehydrogenase [Armatimonadota bacterium]|nr:NAD(P)-dependent alcohol dehydrogenase [Armatimonadota bacterium]